MGTSRRASPKGVVLPAGRVARIALPQTFFEAIFSGFSVMRHEGTEHCVRYWLGSEDQSAFLPFYDHRPGVVRDAGRFDREPSPAGAMSLFRQLGSDAGVEVGTRQVKGRTHCFVNLWPAGDQPADTVLGGAEQDVDPDGLEQGVTLTGERALWYWFGLVPRAPGPDGRKGIKVVRIWLSPEEP